MLWYPERPSGPMRKASRKNSREDKANEPSDPWDAYVYWSDLSAQYSKGADYYLQVGIWWSVVSIIFASISMIFALVTLIV